MTALSVIAAEMAMMVRFAEDTDMFIVPCCFAGRCVRLLRNAIHEACQGLKSAVYLNCRGIGGASLHQGSAYSTNRRGAGRAVHKLNVTLAARRCGASANGSFRPIPATRVVVGSALRAALHQGMIDP
jgi:hypothetical protein